MNRESFIESLREQYSEEIHEIFIECEHRDHKKGKEWVDFHSLNEKLYKVMKCAQAEGLPHTEFMDLVKSALPHFYDGLEFHQEGFTPGLKKAA